MAKRDQLRQLRVGTIINLTSTKQETELGRALQGTVAQLLEEFGLELLHRRSLLLPGIVDQLRREFPDVEFYDPSPKSSMNPDGGVLSIIGLEGQEHPILISEVKHQGTNDLREEEGKGRQAKGNAIERLGKNVIGFRTALLTEGITPFVCFGYGVDFDEGSSILDRVATIAMFGHLNRIEVVDQGSAGQFNRGSFFFRRSAWSSSEMQEIMYTIASRSIHYYFARYGADSFRMVDIDNRS